ncbi:MAG: nucleotidyltransferase domain-containing protein [Thermoproteota archaeon]
MSTLKLSEHIAEAVEKLYRLKGLVLLALYGSVARGEHDRRSDIDIFALFDSRKNHEENMDELMKIRGSLDVTVDIHSSNMEDMAQEDWTFIDNLLRDGHILMVKPPLKIPVEKILNFKPYSVFAYSTSKLTPEKAMKLRRALFSHTEKKKVAGEVRTYRYEGIIRDERARIGRNVIIVPNDLAEAVRKVFARLGVNYEEIKVYAPPLNINF